MNMWFGSETLLALPVPRAEIGGWGRGVMLTSGELGEGEILTCLVVFIPATAVVVAAIAAVWAWAPAAAGGQAAVQAPWGLFLVPSTSLAPSGTSMFLLWQSL